LKNQPHFDTELSPESLQ